MSVRRTALWIFFSLFCLSIAGPALAASGKSDEAARVIAVTPGAFVQRDGTRTPLKLKDSLYKKDKVSTDATGKVQLLFADDTTVAVAPDTVVDLSDFSFGGRTKPNFAMGVGRGLARVVTGKVVEQNREGFKISTPHATVGIRGTILTADVRNPSKSTFILSQLGSGHTVSVLNTATGQKTEMSRAGFSVDAGATGNVQRPATPVEMNAVQTVVRQTKQAPATTAQNDGNASQGQSNAAQQSAAAPAQAAAQSPATENPAPTTTAGAEDASGGHGVAGKGENTVTQVGLGASGADKSDGQKLDQIVADGAVSGGKPNTPGGNPGIPGGSPSVPDGTPSTPGGNPSVPGGDSGIPGGDSGVPGGDSGVPGGDVSPGGDPSTPGGDLGPGAGDNPGGLKAVYAGNLIANDPGIGGNFGFDLNLGSGQIDNGSIHVGISGGATVYSGSNGTGQLNGGDFNVGGFTGAPDTLYGSDGNASMSGTISGDKSAVNVGGWEVNNGHGQSTAGGNGTPGSGGSGSQVSQ